MIRNWKTLALLTATILYVNKPVVVAQTTTDADVKAVLQKLDKMDLNLADSLRNIGVDISAIKKDIDNLKGDSLAQRVEMGKSSKRIEDVEEQVKAMRANLDDLKKRIPIEPTSSIPSVDKASLDEIKSRLGQIEQTLAKLNATTAGSSPRIALSPPSTGRVVLINLYPEELLFVVNKTMHRVAPNMTLPIESIPAGPLNYEVISPTWGRRANNSTILTANETFTLTAR